MTPPVDAGTFGVTVPVPDEALVPAAFVAVTEQVYSVSFVSCGTVTGLLVPVAVFAVPPAVGVHDAV